MKLAFRIVFLYRLLRTLPVMSETKTLISELDQKVSGLLERVQHLHQENLSNKWKIETLEADLQVKANECDHLKNENELLKQQESTNSEVVKDQEELKGKIGEMVKEIDRCISLLKV